MNTLSIYLNFKGDCEEAFQFYQSILGGEFPQLLRYKDMPAEEREKGFPPNQDDKVMHISLAINKNIELMGSDVVGEWGSGFRQGNNFSISLGADSKKEADNLYEHLSAGGKVDMPMSDTFWGDYFGSLTDKFGINWMISTPSKTP